MVLYETWLVNTLRQDRVYPVNRCSVHVCQIHECFIHLQFQESQSDQNYEHVWTVVYPIRSLWNLWQGSWSQIKLTEFLNLVIINILGQIIPLKKSLFHSFFPHLDQTILCCGFCPLNYRMLNYRMFKCISGLYTLDAGSAPPVVTIKNTSRHCQMSSGRQRVCGEIASPWETTGLKMVQAQVQSWLYLTKVDSSSLQSAWLHYTHFDKWDPDTFMSAREGDWRREANPKVH